MFWDHLLKRPLFPPLNCFCTLSKISWACLCGSEIFILFHWSVSIPPTKNPPLSFNYCYYNILEFRWIDLSHFSLIWNFPFAFPYKFYNDFVSTKKKKKKSCCKFGIRLNLYINLGRRDTLGFPVHKLVSLLDLDLH